MREAIHSARRHQSELALLMVDMDRFKEINDTYVHQAGDEVLRVTAERLLEAAKASDTSRPTGRGRVCRSAAGDSRSQAVELVASTLVSAGALMPRITSSRTVVVTAFRSSPSNWTRASGMGPRRADSS